MADEGTKKSFAQSLIKNMQKRAPLPKPHEEVLARDASIKAGLDQLIKEIEGSIADSVARRLPAAPDGTSWQTSHVGVLEDGRIDIGLSSCNHYEESVPFPKAWKDALQTAISDAPEGAMKSGSEYYLSIGEIRLSIDPVKLQDTALQRMAALHASACRVETKGIEIEGYERQFFARLMTVLGLGGLQQKEAYHEPHVIPSEGHKGKSLVSFQVSPGYEEWVKEALDVQFNQKSLTDVKGIELEEADGQRINLWVDIDNLTDQTLSSLGTKLAEAHTEMKTKYAEIQRKWDAFSGVNSQKGREMQ